MENERPKELQINNNERPISPEIDYSDSDDTVESVDNEPKVLSPTEMLQRHLSMTLAGGRPDLESLMNHGDVDLIEPKKIVHVESQDQKEITRQLKWNHNKGIDVLYQTELQKSFKNRRETIKKHEFSKENEKVNFEKTLQNQASKLKHLNGSPTSPPAELCTSPKSIKPTLKSSSSFKLSQPSSIPPSASATIDEFQRIHSRISHKSSVVE